MEQLKSAIAFSAAVAAVIAWLRVRQNATSVEPRKRTTRSERKAARRREAHEWRKKLAPAKKQAAKERKKAKSVAAMNLRPLFTPEELKCAVFV